VRYHGVLSSHSSRRLEVLPEPPPAVHNPLLDAGEGQLALGFDDGTELERPGKRRPWAWLLRHVWQVDVSTCTRCAGPTRRHPSNFGSSSGSRRPTAARHVRRTATLAQTSVLDIAGIAASLPRRPPGFVGRTCSPRPGPRSGFSRPEALLLPLDAVRRTGTLLLFEEFASGNPYPLEIPIRPYPRVTSARSLGNNPAEQLFAEVERALARDYAREWLLRFVMLEDLTRRGSNTPLTEALRRKLEQLEVDYGYEQPIASGLAYLARRVA
jgi:hypothetical protein